MARSNPLTWRNISSPSFGSGAGFGVAARAFESAGKGFREAATYARDRRTDQALADLMADGSINRDELSGLKGVDMKTILDAQRLDQTSREASTSRGIADSVAEQNRRRLTRENSPEALAELQRQLKHEEAMDEANLAARQAANSIAQSQESRFKAENDERVRQLGLAEEANTQLVEATNAIVAPKLEGINATYDQRIRTEANDIRAGFDLTGLSTTEVAALEPQILEAIEVNSGLLNGERQAAIAQARGVAGSQAYGSLVAQNPRMAQYLENSQQAENYDVTFAQAALLDSQDQQAREDHQRNIETLLKPTGKNAYAGTAITISVNGQPSLVSSPGAKGANETTAENVEAYAVANGIDTSDRPKFMELVRLARGNMSALKAAIANSGGVNTDFWKWDSNQPENIKLAKELVQRYAAIAEGYAAALAKANKTPSTTERRRLIDKANENWNDRVYINAQLKKQGIKALDDATQALVNPVDPNAPIGYRPIGGG
jgi:hypothetical protein